MSTILVIDDDADFSAIAAAHFVKLGYRVELAQNGKDGLAKAALLKPDVICLDIRMPGLNGMEVLRELQAGDETSGAPVIIMSGKYIDNGMLDVFAQEKNFRAFLAKPVALDLLQKKVEGLLRK